jgi:hypothetical protein
MQIATNLNSMICLETVPNENKLSHRWRGRKPSKTEARFVGRCELRRSPLELGKSYYGCYDPGLWSATQSFSVAHMTL